jgi:hypothetical protein
MAATLGVIAGDQTLLWLAVSGLISFVGRLSGGVSNHPMGGRYLFGVVGSKTVA